MTVSPPKSHHQDTGLGQDGAAITEHPWAVGTPQGDHPASPTYRLATFADDAAGSEGRHLDVSFKLHFFFRVKEVFLFQFPKYSPLGLGRRREGSKTGGGDDVLMSGSSKTTISSKKPPPAPKRSQTQAGSDPRDVPHLSHRVSPRSKPHLELRLGRPRDDDHPLAGIGTLCWGDLWGTGTRRVRVAPLG